MATRRVELGPAGEHARRELRDIRLRKKWRLEDLASELGRAGHPLSKATLSQIETGGRRIDVDDLVALASALDVEVWQMLPADEDEPMTPREANDILVRHGRGERISQRLVNRAIRLFEDAADE